MLVFIRISLLTLLCLSFSAPAQALDLFVGEGAPYETLAAALADAAELDVIIIQPGEYVVDRLETTAPRIDIIGLDEVILRSTSGRVLRVVHPNVTIENLILDGDFGDDDVLQIRGDGFTMRNVEVRNAGRDCVDATAVTGTLIEGSRIHHCLRSSAAECASDACREDAHGIVGGAVRDFVVRDTEIHTFSGDALQFDPGRDDAGWSGVLVEGCRLWLEPLTDAMGGFAAGVVPGENAFDTKTSDDRVEAAELTIVDTEAFGFRDGLIANMAAYNLKENVRVVLDRVTVFESEIAFRLRGATSSRPRGADVTIRNAVVHDVDVAIRYEDEITEVRVQHTTFGSGIEQLTRDVSEAGRIVSENVLVLGEVPADLPGAVAATSDDFVNAAADDYHLLASSSAVDAGEPIDGVVIDRDGNARDGMPDLGAYEFCEGSCGEGDAGTDAGADAGTDAGTDAGADADSDAGADAGSDAGADADAGADSGSADDAGERDSGGTSDAEPGSDAEDSGCSCRVGGQSHPPWALILLGALIWRRRKRT